MAMTEAPFSLTIKVGPNNDLLTGRAETAAEMAQRVQDLHSIAASMQGGNTTSTANDAAAVDRAIQALESAGMTAPSTGGIEQRDDQWGNQYTKGVPDAGGCSHGPRIVKNGTNKSGKRYKAFVCVNDSPFREGKYDKSAICEIAWPPKS